MRMRLAGKCVTFICEQLKRSREWFYIWWHRYQDYGADGLRDQTRKPKVSPRAITEEIRAAILSIRDRLTRRRGAQARYRLTGAPTIRHELEILGYTPLPGLRTIERVLQRGGRTSPPFRTQPTSHSAAYPAPHVTGSNQVHQFDIVGPRYLKGSSIRYYFLVYKDVHDQTPFIGFFRGLDLDIVLAFLVQAWQRLGLPRILQVDNDHLFVGTGRWPGSLSRFVRLVLLVGIELLFIPEGEPFRNGAVENFNGWFQARLLAIPLRNPTHVRRELRALMEVCSREHVHPHLGFRTAWEVRRSLRPRTLPADFKRHLEPLPIAVGKITFMRKVRISGRVTILNMKVRVGKRWHGYYIRAVLYTRNAHLKIYHGNRLVKELDFPIRGT
jgi:hypothetical protein